ncbi:MAG: hypothetical protein RLZZ387_31 [Chloroflexota bacterium]|jgi:uncharacterized damage-inducible protein DinB
MSRRAVLIESLESAPRDLARLLRPVSAEDALRRPAPDAWSIAELVAHLAYTEERMLARLRRILAEDTPTVEYIEDPGGHDLSAPLTGLLERFVARRAETVAFLQGLDQRDWGRPLIHPRIGSTRLREQVQAIVDHDSEHLAEIAHIREAGGL